MVNVVIALLVLGILGLVFGVILAVASKIFEVKTDPRFPEIMDCLPGANCGGCGYAGCSAAAKPPRGASQKADAKVKPDARQKNSETKH